MNKTTLSHYRLRGGSSMSEEEKAAWILDANHEGALTISAIYVQCGRLISKADIRRICKQIKKELKS